MSELLHFSEHRLQEGALLFMAIVILQVLQSGLNILGFNPFVKKFIWGLILILVMVINFYQTNGRLWRNLVRKHIGSGAS